MSGKVGKAKLDAAVKRLFSATFDLDEPLPEDILIKRADLETVLIVFKELYMIRKLTAPAPPFEAPTLHPAQR